MANAHTVHKANINKMEHATNVQKTEHLMPV